MNFAPFAFLFFDPMYLLFAIPGLLLSLLASWHTKSTFKKYQKISGSKGYSGAEAAAEMLRRNGVHDCKIEMTQGFLSDHYDPTCKTLRLSPDVYNGRSLSSIGVACHEAGHALQHAASYSFLTMRTALVPLVGIGSNVGLWVIMGGFIFQAKPVVALGIILFALAFVFSVVTLPVEWDASARAKTAMMSAGLLAPREVDGAGKVLNAAFLTYFAAAVSSLLVLLYYVMRYMNMRDE